MRKLGFFIILTMGLTINAGIFSGSNKKVQKAMKDYVAHHIGEDSFLPILHKGIVLKLSWAKTKKYPDGFHSGVKTKGNLYVSCADFVDSKGNKYDVDFLVNKVNNSYSVVQGVVHSVNGEKNPYDLSH